MSQKNGTRIENTFENKKEKKRGKNNGHMYIVLKTMQCLQKFSWLGDRENCM